MIAPSLSTTRIVKAPRARVFAAWTTPELLKKWWGPGHVSCPEAYVDLRVGGEYRIANLEADGSITWISGFFESIRAPEQLIYSWSVSRLPGKPTLVTVNFREHPLGTELVLKHERFDRDALRNMHLQGWGGCLDKLEALLSP